MTKDHPAEERKLLSRLRVMGYILCFFGAVWLFYALTCSLPEPNFPLEEFSLEEEGIFPSDFAPHQEMLNFFLLSIVFAALGIFCLWFTRKKSHKA